MAAALSPAGCLQLEICARILRQRAESVVCDFSGLSLRQVWVLIAASAQTPVTQKKVAVHLALNQNVIVALVDNLEKSGHVQRVRNPANRREQFVRLTTKGRNTVRRLLAARPKLYLHIFSPLDNAKIHVLLKEAKAILTHEREQSQPLK